MAVRHVGGGGPDRHAAEAGIQCFRFHRFSNKTGT